MSDVPCWVNRLPAVVEHPVVGLDWSPHNSEHILVALGAGAHVRLWNLESLTAPDAEFTCA